MRDCYVTLADLRDTKSKNGSQKEWARRRSVACWQSPSSGVKLEVLCIKGIVYPCSEPDEQSEESIIIMIMMTMVTTTTMMMTMMMLVVVVLLVGELVLVVVVVIMMITNKIREWPFETTWFRLPNHQMY